LGRGGPRRLPARGLRPAGPAGRGTRVLTGPALRRAAAAVLLAAGAARAAGAPPPGEAVAATPEAVYAWAARRGLDLKGWELESVDGSSAAFYVRDVPLGPLMRLTFRLEYFRPAPLGDGRQVRSVSGVVEVDCRAGRSRYLQTRLYAGNDFKDFIRKDPDTAWAPLDPSNPHDGYFQDRCAGR